MVYFISFILALFATMLMIPPLIYAANRFGFVDIPNHRKVHVKAIPRIGGVAFFLGALLPIGIWAPLSPEAIGYLVGGAVIVVFGLVDDRLELGFKTKLVGQLIASVVVIGYGGIVVDDLPGFLGGEDISLFVAGPLTVFLIISVTNAVNFSDGLDGLAGGVVLVSLLLIAVMAIESEVLDATIIAIALTGAILGFLQFNSHPAKIFMGDTGSQFLGYSVSVLAIWITQNEFGAYAASIPLLVVGLPLIDIVVVTLNRKLDGKSLFEPDKTHFHHRMLSLGLDHLEAVMVTYVLQIVLAVIAYLFRFSSDAYVVAAFSLFLVSFTLAFRFSHVLRGRFRPQLSGIGSSSFAQKVNYLRKGGGFSKLACIYSVTAVALYYSYGVFAVEAFSFTSSMVAVVLFIVIVVFRLVGKNAFTDWFERVLFYGVACALVFLVEPVSGDSRLMLVFFAVLGAIVFIGMHYTRNIRVTVKPLDVLVLVIVLSLPKVFSTLGIDQRYAYSAFHLLVLFYAIELLLETSTYHCGKQKYIKLGLIAPLLVLGVRGIL